LGGSGSHNSRGSVPSSSSWLKPSSPPSQPPLPPPPGVRVLSLASNGIGDEGASALASACVRGGITHLNLAMNKVGEPLS
jgi:hypothetical protein